MGDVYQAIDSKLGRGVAIKLLPQEFASDPDALAGNDKIYDDVFRQSRVIRARSLREALDKRDVVELASCAGDEHVQRRVVACDGECAVV